MAGSSPDNLSVIEAWNTVLFDKFSRFRHLLVEGLSGHSDELLGRGIHRPGERIVDLGCGFGDTTLRLARAVAPTGQVVGVDCAPRFIEASREGARHGDAVASSAEFVVADVQTERFGGPFDAAFSRFGTMFFAMPGAAMRNVRRHLRPGGRLDMIVWRRREDNPWLHEAELCVREIVPVIDPDESDQVHCGPGPFSMASPDLVSAMLTGVGFEHVSFERYDTDICIGRTLEEAIDFALALGPAGEVMRLAGEEGARRQPEVRQALSQAMSRYVREDGVWAGSSTWFVSARNPC